jgi:hypothetical protein
MDFSSRNPNVGFEGGFFCFNQHKVLQACHYTGFNGRLPIVQLLIPIREELLMINRRPYNVALRNVVFSGPDRSTMVHDAFRRVQA